MATIRKRGSSWQVQVRRQGAPALSKTFRSRADALLWARDKECAIDRAELPANARELRRISIGDLLRRYLETITPRRRGAGPERYRLEQLLQASIAQISLDRLSP